MTGSVTMNVQFKTSMLLKPFLYCVVVPLVYLGADPERVCRMAKRFMFWRISDAGKWRRLP